ncbi:glycine--tRNA ligase [Micrococcus sp. EYE_162]|uniref:glycine--tRNA ligase n=1 Tax=unclassified Micrococcus TaxID=2620948 RepID=UPI002004DB34|nr:MULTISPECIES: glycine--tRNA ligase [unclassified Micrococcus]MCK6096237.1 glycine--tRNA ligase [Micrococcus sp. EYE_212]MCK6171881.1 glycine--tRNA ligase [Micrococcus sp. EYE_162]
MAAKSPLENVISLAKRRGFVFQAGEIYGGSRSAWDYGPLGVELKENIKAEWWKTFVRSREDMVGLDSSIILPRQVWQASGHVDTFTDPLVECQQCHRRHRQDHLVEAFEAKKGRAPEGMQDIVCPDCGTKGMFTEPQMFSGLMKTFLGPVDNEEGLHYMRPETAQGIFVNFLNVLGASRKKPPFGIGQIGKAFRNEITPGNFIFRTREFEQMEIEYFVPPADAQRHFDTWVEACWNWFIDLGIDPENLRRFDVPAEERAHYSDGTIDLEYKFGFGGGDGWGELMGVANRTDYDLSSHTTASGTKLQYFDQANGEHYTPYVIEPSFGLTRSMMAFLVDAYAEEEAPNAKGGTDVRTVLRLDPRLAPVKAAVLPLSKKEELQPATQALAAELRREWNIETDDSGAIGRRYRRQDEIGTPFCITVDFDTLEDQAVTVRERDTMAQERVALSQVKAYLAERLTK